jgi:ribosomal-protein-alanine N-acetyltransferase
MAFDFRDGNIDDIEAVFRLNRDVFDEAWSKDMMLQSLQVGYDLYVCYEDKSLVGYLLSQDILFETQLMQLAVSQACRRKGVAQKLMQMLIQDKQGMDNLILEVRLSNASAQSFYAQTGFSELARRPNYYRKTPTKPREDAVLMGYDFTLGRVQ